MPGTSTTLMIAKGRVCAFGIALLGSLALVSGPVSAGELHEDWNFTLGGGAYFGPEYRGADDFKVSPLPLVRIGYKDILFLDAQEGLGWNALNLKNYKAGPLVRYYWGSDDAPTGVEEVDGGVQVGGFFEFAFDHFKFDATALQAVTGSSEGFRGDLGFSYGTKINKDWIVTARVGTTFMNGNEMGTYFGINDRESSDSGLAKYTPDAGMENVGLSLMVRYQITPWSSFTLVGGYDYLLPEASDSGIVAEENQFSVGGGLAFHF